jgi:tRNA(Ile)-lysidine synthase
MRKTIRARRLLAPGQRVIVAVSGGADSVALLLALKDAATRLLIHLEAAHFDHRLRGADSDADAGFVADVAARLGVPFHLGRAAAPLSGPALEARARRERYFFLEGLAGRLGVERIATAHTADDQAETVLMRLLRGSGADGLQAIRFRRGRIVRPLLECTRADVLAHLAAAQQTFREDASNSDRRFLRNRVRHEVLPALAAVNPRVRAALARTATVIQDEHRLLDRTARRALTAEGMVDAQGLSLDRLGRLAAPLRPRVVRNWLAGAGVGGLTHERLETVLAVARGGDRRAASDLPGGWRVARVDGRLVVFRPANG